MILSDKDVNYLDSLVDSFNKELSTIISTDVDISSLSMEELRSVFKETERRNEAREIKELISKLVNSYLSNIKIIIDSNKSFKTKVDSTVKDSQNNIFKLQSTLSSIEMMLSDKAEKNHEHNDDYAPLTHSHSEFANKEHEHSSLRTLVITSADMLEKKVNKALANTANLDSEYAKKQHAKEHLIGEDQIPIATNKTRGLASPDHIKRLEKVERDMVSKVSSVSFGSGGTTNTGTVDQDLQVGTNTLILNDKLPSDESFSGISYTGVIGYAATQGDIVYLSVSDGRWEAALADSATTSGDVVLGIVMESNKVDGDSCKIFLQGMARSAAFGSLSNTGDAIYIDASTAGNMTQTAPSTSTNIVRLLGHLIDSTTDTIYFNPSSNWLVVA